MASRVTRSDKELLSETLEQIDHALTQGDVDAALRIARSDEERFLTQCERLDTTPLDTRAKCMASAICGILWLHERAAKIMAPFCSYDAARHDPVSIDDAMLGLIEDPALANEVRTVLSYVALRLRCPTEAKRLALEATRGFGDLRRPAKASNARLRLGSVWAHIRLAQATLPRDPHTAGQSLNAARQLLDEAASIHLAWQGHELIAEAYLDEILAAYHLDTCNTAEALKFARTAQRLHTNPTVVNGKSINLKDTIRWGMCEIAQARVLLLGDASARQLAIQLLGEAKDHLQGHPLRPRVDILLIESSVRGNLRSLSDLNVRAAGLLEGPDRLQNYYMRAQLRRIHCWILRGLSDQKGLRDSANSLIAENTELTTGGRRGLPDALVIDATLQLGLSYTLEGYNAEPPDYPQARKYLLEARRDAHDARKLGIEAFACLELLRIAPLLPDYAEQSSAIAAWRCRVVELESHNLSDYVATRIKEARDEWASISREWAAALPTANPQLAGVIVETELWLHYLQLTHLPDKPSPPKWLVRARELSGLSAKTERRLEGLDHYPGAKEEGRFEGIQKRLVLSKGVAEKTSQDRASKLMARWEKSYPDAFELVKKRLV